MLKQLNTSYLIVGGGVFLLFLPWVEPNYLFLSLFNIFSLVVYLLVINAATNLKSYKSTHLAEIVFLYSFVFVVIYNVISFGYRGNFFMFSEIDAVMYDTYSRRMAAMPLWESIRYFLQFYAVDDLGMPVILSTLYRIIDSNLFYNLFNVVIGSITAVGMFKVGRYVMSEKYAFICALAFSLSSFFLWYHASGLKESFMVMLIVHLYYHYYKFIHEKKIRDVLFVVFISLVFIFFRPVLILFFLTSIGLGILFDRVKGYQRILFFIVIVIITYVSFSFFEEAFFRFLKEGDLELLVAAKAADGMVIGSLPLTYSVNVMSQIMGPLPTVVPYLSYLSLFSSGLIYRVFLSFPFWLGIYFIYKSKKRTLYPLAIFVLMEMSSLALILEGIQLRKSMPHLPLVYIIAFWFLYHYNAVFIKRKYLLRWSFVVFALVVFVMCTIWNFR